MVIDTKSDNRSDNSAKITHSLQAEKAAFIETISDALLQAKGITPYKSVLQMEVTDLSGNTHRIQSLLESKYIAPDVLEYIANHLIENYPYYGIGYDTLARSIVVRNNKHIFESTESLYETLEEIHLKAIEPKELTTDVPKFLYNFLFSIVLFYPIISEFQQYLMHVKLTYADLAQSIDNTQWAALNNIISKRIEIYKQKNNSILYPFGSFDL